ncbi:GNAT family N-acetyltransferase [Roseibium litorale]|uniref:GNAT family N-acetyltransferase n=1 Tax=Roseibium litorale TaxID=2803841 RepID=A0ABR9CI70_9HYPH|nr:GNAT family N-acetyltransferase [Roseibium litorale]MBD8890525.1 GNAT family N-acetyltransferase [Roseibium litorale]
MTLKIRSACSSDTKDLTAILYEAKGSRGYTLEQMDGFRSQFRIDDALLENMDVIVAELDGKPVGFAAGCLQPDHYLIDYLFVLPETAGRGIGRLLLERISDLASTLSAQRLRLESDAYAEAFYLARGFKRVSTLSSQMAPSGKIPVMEKDLSPMVQELKSLDIRLDRTSCWPFEESNRDAINAHWSKALDRNPHLWNGRVLKLTSHVFDDGILTGICHETSFAAFLAWRDWGAPDRTTRNLFGSALIRSREGFLLYGVMSEWTANPGQIYPPGGNIDMADVREDGRVNVLGSLYRELVEETGLTPDQVIEGPLFAVFDGPRLCIGRVMNIDEPAEELRTRILAHSLASEEQELSDVRILRTSSDGQSPKTTTYARALARKLLPERHQ